MSSKHIKIESYNGRTYGECIRDEIDSIRMIDGKFVTTLQIKKKPQRLSRDQALSYYTAKLRAYWNNEL